MLLRHNSQVNKTILTNTEYIEHHGVYFLKNDAFL